jgi:hypothetical protein
MSPEFLAAVIDTLLPVETTPPTGAAPLPSGTAAGLAPRDYAASHAPVFSAIAEQASGIEAFMAADEAVRASAIEAVERRMPDAFRALLTAVLSDYYESPAVLAALGWPTDPPQPAGHALADMDEVTAARLKRVAQRTRLWRN